MTTVDLPQSRVQERGELDGLAIGAADQGRRDTVAGSRHFPNQFDTVRSVQDRLRRSCNLGGHSHLSAPGRINSFSGVVKRQPAEVPPLSPLLVPPLSPLVPVAVPPALSPVPVPCAMDDV
jgi:hypothetical protein